jgi:hypothetical protein
MIIIVFCMVAAFEWSYLKRRSRKKRTYIIVFGLLVISLLYNLGVYFHIPYVPNPTSLVSRVFKPLQDIILVK